MAKSNVCDNIKCFVAGINRGPFRFLKEAHTNTPDSEFVESRNNDKDIFRCAIDQAWLDMCRTLRGKKTKTKNLEKCKENMAESLEQYFSIKPRKSKCEFDKWHNETTLQFREVKNFTVGQSQKILNMAMKYLYCCNNYRIEKKEYFKYCHMPLDSYILNWYKSDVDKDYDIEPWSKIDDLDKYNEKVDKIRQALGTEYVLEKEFEIWHTEKERADKKALRACANRIIESPACSKALKELLQKVCDELKVD